MKYSGKSTSVPHKHKNTSDHPDKLLVFHAMHQHVHFCYEICSSNHLRFSTTVSLLHYQIYPLVDNFNHSLIYYICLSFFLFI